MTHEYMLYFVYEDRLKFCITCPLESKHKCFWTIYDTSSGTTFGTNIPNRSSELAVLWNDGKVLDTTQGPLYHYITDEINVIHKAICIWKASMQESLEITDYLNKTMDTTEFKRTDAHWTKL